MRPSRRHVSLVLRVGISVGLLVLLFRAVDFREVLGLLREAKPGPLVAAVVLYCVFGTYARAQRWRELVEALGERISVSRATELFLVGTLFGQALPTGVGGDVVRALLLARDGFGRARALNTVLVDRALGLLPLLATGLVALALAPGRASPTVSAMMLVFGAVGLIGMAVLLRAHRWRDKMERIPLLGWLVARPGIARFIDAFGDYSTRALARATTWSLVFIALLVATNVLLGKSLGIDVGGGVGLGDRGALGVAVAAPAVDRWVGCARVDVRGIARHPRSACRPASGNSGLDHARCAQPAARGGRRRSARCRGPIRPARHVRHHGAGRCVDRGPRRFRRVHRRSMSGPWRR